MKTATSNSSPIQLKPVTIEDYDLYRSWFNDLDIKKWLIPPLSTTPYTKILHQMLMNPKKHQFYTYFGDGTAIGVVGFVAIDQFTQRAEVLYLCGNKNYQGRGLTSLALASLCHIGFDEFGFRSLWAQIADSNLGSKKVATKNQFVQCGRFQQGFYDRQHCDLILFEKLNPSLEAESPRV